MFDRLMMLVGVALVMLSPFAVAAVAHADVPDLVPVQAWLTDDAGTPIDGEREVTFTLHDGDSLTVAAWTETQTLRVDHGLLSAHLGAVTALDDDVFDTAGSLWLGVAVAGVELAPRVQLTTAPYAARSEHAEEAATLQGATLDELMITAGEGVSMTQQTLSIDPSFVDARARAACMDTATEVRAAMNNAPVSASALSVAGCHTVTVTKAMPPAYGYSTYVRPGAGVDTDAVKFCGAGMAPVVSGCRLDSWQDVGNASQYYKVSIWATGIRADGISHCRAYNQATNLTIASHHTVRCCPVAL